MEFANGYCMDVHYNGKRMRFRDIFSDIHDMREIKSAL